MDLNLFRVFDAILTHRSVAAAGREMGVTASAVSHALARLRKLLGDDLFLPGPDGMVPTPRALELAPNIREGLGSIAKVLETRSFVPGETVRTFGIAATDYACMILLPGLLKALSSSAPNANIRVAPLGRLDIVQQLDDGRLDFVLGWFDSMPSRLKRQALLEEHEAMVVRAGHPLTRQPLTKRRLFGFPHIVVELTGSEDPSEGGFFHDRGVMRRIWIERLLVENARTGARALGRIAATVPSYGSIAPVIQATDMVATLPRRLAQRAVQRDGLVMLDLPYLPLSVLVEMVWHERARADPGLQWLIQEVRAVADAVIRAERDGPVEPGQGSDRTPEPRY